MKLLPGTPHPLGATWDGKGTNFAVYSENATAVELCLFDSAGNEERIALTSQTAFVWHGYADGIAPGQRYGFRVHGPYEPERGLRFNANVVLLDPYAKALDGVERWEEGCFAYPLGSEEGDLSPSEDPQLGAPRALVVDTSFDWEGDQRPQTPLHRSVIYEAHAKGLTQLHPDIPAEIRGTYAAIGHPAMVSYFRDLGITAIELMPIHSFVDDKHLLDKGLRNYWGYNSIGFFAPDLRYRAGTEPGSEVRQFKEMVKALHRAGIEVILDVVYNHTAEGNHLGPTLSFKGLDNTTYYRLVQENPRFYFDYTGTGNTLNVRHPQVLALIMDSLRYWATEMHVDGFRFDLASALARSFDSVDQLSSFFTLIHQSPVLNECKLIAEPWDVGEGGYQVGNFPVRWAEWNGKYRDSVRAVWRGDGGKAAEIGYRLTGSSDLYEGSGRKPSASINFITAHDGFTLNDLVSYNEKHNLANGENNQDGNNNEHSWNCGAEGTTDDPRVNDLRQRQRRNFLATLLLSQGTPLLVAGDEFGRSQQGNNNAYCQDNEISWIDWSWRENPESEQYQLFSFVRALMRFRLEHPAIHRSKFFQGRPIHGRDLHDLLWFRHDGETMSDEDWDNPVTKSMAMFLAGRGIDDVDETGRALVDDDLLVLLNAGDSDLDFRLPTLHGEPGEDEEPWQKIFDTSIEASSTKDSSFPHVPLLQKLREGSSVALSNRSLQVYLRPSRVLREGGALHTLGSTYRLQLHQGFGFRQAQQTLDYLSKLGVTDLYLSPIFAASEGSTHGYDVVDHNRFNPALGSEEDFVALSDALKARGMGLLVDWVPNHMGIASTQNLWWADVLENGPSSIHADCFDIDWNPSRVDLQNRVLLPVLGDQYGEVLERGELSIIWEEQRFRVAYFDRRFPLGPKTMAQVIDLVLANLDLPENDPARLELESINSGLRHLPSRDETGPEERKERGREKEILKERLSILSSKNQRVEEAIGSALVALNGVVGVPNSFDSLDAILSLQSYRLASWKVAAEEINYRRFFDVNDLAALRMEDPKVFEAAHALLFRMIDEGRIQALRLDHTDGLYDPYGYFEAIQRRFHSATQSTGPDDEARPIPLLVEKILEGGETLPLTWPIDGTTGYEFSSALLGLWVKSENESVFNERYARFTDDDTSFEEHVYQSKQHVLAHTLSSEVNMLARALERIAMHNRKWRDFTLQSLTVALSETIAAFPVYRTYFRLEERPSDQDKKHVRSAITLAKQRNPQVNESVFSFLERVLLMQTLGSNEEQAEQRSFALRFQQLTGPATAKSVEDTAFYRYSRLACLNEVGSNPARFGISTQEFHLQNQERARSWPLSMVTTSTHDTKRGEDTSARIAVLSEMPEEWFEALDEMHRLSQAKEDMPGREMEVLLYQTIVGAWPIGWDGRANREAFAERLAEYLLKASKEAKLRTSWTSADANYDEALPRFVRTLFRNEEFVGLTRNLDERVTNAGVVNSLSSTAIKFCSPGVPDLYQGSELWNQSLVDPDNRRDVDFSLRARILEGLSSQQKPDSQLLKGLLEECPTGKIKLFVTQTLLQVRKQNEMLFRKGSYAALDAGEHAVAFKRRFEQTILICCTPKHSLSLCEQSDSGWPLGDLWQNQVLSLSEPGRYRNLFTGELYDSQSSIPLRDVFRDLPVAVLLAELEGGA